VNRREAGTSLNAINNGYDMHCRPNRQFSDSNGLSAVEISLALSSDFDVVLTVECVDENSGIP